MTQFDKRNISMMMDFYELTMANGYFAEKDKDTQVAFDVFYRANPDEGGFAIFAGLEHTLKTCAFPIRTSNISEDRESFIRIFLHI